MFGILNTINNPDPNFNLFYLDQGELGFFTLSSIMYFLNQFETGKLHFCSRNIIFQPNNSSLPVSRIGISEFISYQLSSVKDIEKSLLSNKHKERKVKVPKADNIGKIGDIRGRARIYSDGIPYPLNPIIYFSNNIQISYIDSPLQHNIINLLLVFKQQFIIIDLDNFKQAYSVDQEIVFPNELSDIFGKIENPQLTHTFLVETKAIEIIPRAPFAAKEKQLTFKSERKVFLINQECYIQNEKRIIDFLSSVNKPTIDTPKMIEQKYMETYQVEKKLLQGVSLKQKCRRILIDGIQHGIFIITRDGIVKYQGVLNAFEGKYIEFPLSSLKIVLKFRYMFKYQAIKLCTYNSKGCFLFQFDSEQIVDTLLSYLQRHAKNLYLEVQNISFFTEKWQIGELTNFDYIMYLNHLGGRTFNDLAQYPIFPWIIKSYNTNELEIQNLKDLRDLGKPLGMITSEKEEKYKEKYKEMLRYSGTEEAYLYGSTYSCPGIVMYYLIRLVPGMMLRLQSNTFGPADKLLTNINAAWNSNLNNYADLKELTPEFYSPTHSQFLINCENIDLGTFHSGQKIGQVILPDWAKNALTFTSKLHDMFEGDLVSSQLNKWIDLIFGYSQSGAEALNANNMFYPSSYAGSTKQGATGLEEEAMLVQIREFGQIPVQLFNFPHPERKSRKILFMQPGKELVNGRSEVLAMITVTTKEVEKLRSELEDNRKNLRDNLKRKLTEFKTYEEKYKAKIERYKASFQKQKERYQKVINELYQKNVSLKEDFEDFDKGKDKYYLNTIETMKELHKKTLIKSTKNQNAQYLKTLEVKIRKLEADEKKQMISFEKMRESNSFLKKKNIDLQRKLQILEEKNKFYSSQQYFSPKK